MFIGSLKQLQKKAVQVPHHFVLDFSVALTSSLAISSKGTLIIVYVILRNKNQINNIVLTSN